VSSGTNGGKSYDSYAADGAERARVTPYCFGWRTTTSAALRGFNPLGFPNEQDAYAGKNTSWTTDTRSNRVDSSFMLNFLAASFGHQRNLGHKVDPLLRKWSRLQLSIGGDPQHNKYLCCTYRVPTWDLSNEHPKSSVQHVAMYTDAGQSKDYWNCAPGHTCESSDATDSPCDANDGYAHYYLGALSFMVDYAWGVARGSDVWEWFWNETNFPNGQSKILGCTGTDVSPKWAIVPKRDPTRAVVEPGDTFAVFRYVAPLADSSCTVAGSADGLSGTSREYVLTGLSAGHPYDHEVVCGGVVSDAVTLGYSTLSAFSGTGALSLRLGSGSTEVSIEHGASRSLGSSYTQPCSGGCVVTIGSLSKGLRYYRLRRDSGAWGPVRALIVR
jgi:hypothetical protein